MGNGHESDSRVLEVTGDRRADHLAHDLVDTAHALASGHPRANITAGSTADVVERHQVATERAPVRTTRVDEALQLVGPLADLRPAHQAAEQHRAPAVVVG